MYSVFECLCKICNAEEEINRKATFLLMLVDSDRPNAFSFWSFSVARLKKLRVWAYTQTDVHVLMHTHTFINVYIHTIVACVCLCSCPYERIHTGDRL